ncbi:hypothetical protein [Fulvivirga ligni]|uniref:hypothetical protein n=1 Tax=Fulvivirga ligni TaxID=2904246 RepID=UPI001F231DED|nr:hypothetical protein [Fulvivirga ligni]UII19210.1 hypothetical protein LVD16_15295 [Fulvivirga ligni]
METTLQEAKNKRAGLIVAALTHAIVLLICLFILAWEPPDPPRPEYGIMVNFGNSAKGTGDIQPTQPVEETKSDEEAAPEEVPEAAEEQVSEAEPVVEEAQTDVQEVAPTPVSTQPSPDVVPEKKVEQKKPEVKKEVVEKPKEVTKPAEKPPVKPSTGANGKSGTNDTPQNSSQGNSTGATGDQGKPEGNLDSRALVGSTWDGSGSSLSMTGWVWDSRPDPKDESSENGRIVFQIKIDDRGEILSITTLERSVSPDVEKKYRAAVQELTFSKTADNTIPAPMSTGTITFNIKSK